MVKNFIVLSYILIPSILFSQDDLPVANNKGLLRTMGIMSFGSMTKYEQTNIYLTGNLEYFTNSHISARGDIYYYLKSGNKQMLNQNHQLFAGSSYHFTKNSTFVPYIGIQPGIAITQSNAVTVNQQNEIAISPLISGVAGFNYFASKWFHLFIDSRYVAGKHLSNTIPLSLNEFRISFGLGFNFNLLEKK